MDLYSLPFFVFLFIIISIYFLALTIQVELSCWQQVTIFMEPLRFSMCLSSPFQQSLLIPQPCSWRDNQAHREKEKSFLQVVSVIWVFSFCSNVTTFQRLSIAIILNKFNPILSKPFYSSCCSRGNLVLYFSDSKLYDRCVPGNKNRRESISGFLPFMFPSFPSSWQGYRTGKAVPSSKLHEYHRWDWERSQMDLSSWFWGLFKKMVVADRLLVFVDTVFNNLNAL